MATTKISALPAATTADAADLTIAVNGSSDEKATVTQIATFSRAVASATTVSAIVGSGSSLTVNTALADSDTRIASTTSATLFFVDAGLDKVGIATAVPTQKLDVTGTVDATLFAGSGASLTGLGATSTAFRTVATDPSPLVAGDVWYNSTSDAFKCAPAVAGTWASGATMVGLDGGLGSGIGYGTVTAALAAGIEDQVLGPVATTEKYNGSTWASAGSMSYARRSGSGCGTATAGLQAGGTTATGYCDTYNGSVWSAGGTMSSQRTYMGSAGASSTAGIVFGGGIPGATATVESYNGSSWTSGTALPATRNKVGGCGTSTAALAVGGIQGATYDGLVYTYNGSAWSAGGTMVAAAAQVQVTGTTTSSISCGGYNGAAYLATAAKYNGSTWGSTGSLSTARHSHGGAGAVSTGSYVFGGTNSAGVNISSTELYSETITAKTFTVA